MTLEGEYYFTIPHKRRLLQLPVAILMTLEGEYYLMGIKFPEIVKFSRNPHDIGRRILLLNVEGKNLYCKKSQSS